MNWKKILSLFLLTSFLAITVSACSFTFPKNATGNPLGPKVGVSSASVIFGLAFDQDASIVAAAKEGGITEIATVEYRYQDVLGIFEMHTCIVTGK
jgi:hypothetical protein